MNLKPLLFLTVEKAGGKALPLQTNMLEDDSIKNMIDQTVAKFGGIDILLTNASSLNQNTVEGTPMKRFDLINRIISRGTFLASKLAIPHLKNAKNPHILNICPPLLLNPRYTNNMVPLSIAKYGASMCVIGMAQEFKGQIAVNGLWPR